MKLKTRVASLDDVPEQYRASYVAAEDGKSFSLEELELEDTTGLKANHDRLLKQQKAAQEEIKKLHETYNGVDPVKAREAQKKLDELESKQMMDEGKFEELFIKRTEAMKRDHENQVAALAKKIEAEAERAGTLEKQLQRTTIANQVTDRASKHKIKSEFLPFLQLAAEKAWLLDEDGSPVWKENGQVKFGKDPSKPATMDDYFVELIAAAPSMLEGSNGTGATGNAGRTNGALSISKRDLSDVRNYEALKAKADKPGVQVNVTE